MEDNESKNAETASGEIDFRLARTSRIAENVENHALGYIWKKKKI
mgnify:CR=1 FL=1